MILCVYTTVQIAIMVQSNRRTLQGKYLLQSEYIIATTQFVVVYNLLHKAQWREVHDSEWNASNVQLKPCFTAIANMQLESQN